MERLTREEFEQTIQAPMARRGAEEGPPFDFWPYFDGLPPAEFAGRDFSQCQVDVVYRDASGRYEHVLLRCDVPDVFLALVLDLAFDEVMGHRILDLDAEYGHGTESTG